MLKGIVSLKPSSNISKRKTSLSQTGIGKKKKPAESSVKVMVGRCECMHLYSILTKVVLLLLIKPILLADQNGDIP